MKTTTADAHRRALAAARTERALTTGELSRLPVIGGVLRRRCANAADMANAVLELDAGMRAGLQPPRAWLLTSAVASPPASDQPGHHLGTRLDHLARVATDPNGWREITQARLLLLEVAPEIHALHRYVAALEAEYLDPEEPGPNPALFTRTVQAYRRALGCLVIVVAFAQAEPDLPTKEAAIPTLRRLGLLP